MAIPTLTSISPATAPTAGGDVVRLTGTGFAPAVDYDDTTDTPGGRRMDPDRNARDRRVSGAVVCASPADMS